MNLGTFLGTITLGSNRPLLTREFDLKQTLLEALDQGPQKVRLVVPFVSKVIKETTKSQVFKPSNPFVMGLLQVLKEIAEVKLHTSKDTLMEIDSLFKHIGVNIADV